MRPKPIRRKITKVKSYFGKYWSQLYNAFKFNTFLISCVTGMTYNGKINILYSGYQSLFNIDGHYNIEETIRP